MLVRPATLLFMLKILIACLLLVAILLLISLLPPPTGSKLASAKVKNSSTSILDGDMASSPNIVTSGFVKITDGVGSSLYSVSHSLSNTIQTTASETAAFSKSISSGVHSATSSVTRTLGGGISSVGNSIGDGVVFVVKLPGKTIGAISRAPGLRSFIRPTEHTEIPIIDPNSPELAAAIAALPPTQNVNKKVSNKNAKPRWPIHGYITADFGSPHWPFQRYHTGVDIADGKPAGTTPIKPFRPGKVIDTVFINYDLGNHVFIDHGNGVISVYGHMNSISVKVGQQVDTSTTLGFVGSTGMSTGPHVHLEIRVNGKLADPHKFISGQP